MNPLILYKQQFGFQWCSMQRHNIQSFSVSTTICLVMKSVSIRRQRRQKRQPMTSYEQNLPVRLTLPSQFECMQYAITSSSNKLIVECISFIRWWVVFPESTFCLGCFFFHSIWQFRGVRMLIIFVPYNYSNI